MSAPDDRQGSTSTGRVAGGRVLQEVARLLDKLRFGSVEITVHEGRVTQIESRGKIRLP